MSHSKKPIAMASEYSCDIKNRFAQNGEKLFLVDYSISAAVSRVPELLPDAKHTVLCIVENAAMATEFCDIFTPVYGDFHVVASQSDLDQLLLEAEFKKEAPFDFVARVKAAHPRLLLVATDADGVSLLHKKLCSNKTKAGVFDSGNGTAPLCLSDALAGDPYDYLIVNNVYSLFSFERRSDEETVYEPTLFDRVDFLEDTYFSDVAHSHKRLKNMVNAAKKAVLLSDVVLQKDAVELYVVLDMLHPAFSQVAARARMASMADNYAEICERICTDVSYCKEDEEILSSCLQKTKGSLQRVPPDINSLKNYLDEAVSYMAEEELFLRVIEACIRIHGKRADTLDRIVEILGSDPMEMAGCLCEIFFADTIKGELEMAISAAHVSQMKKEEIGALLCTFLDRGAYHCFFGDDSFCKVLRLKHDISGFECFTRRAMQGRADDDLTFSVLHSADDLTYKCVAIQQLLSGARDGASIAFPLMVVTNTDAVPNVAKALELTLPGKAILTDVKDFCQYEAKDGAVLLIDYATLRQTARPIAVKCTIFFDLAFDMTVQKLMLNKVRAYGSELALLLVGYEDLSGHLMDYWQDVLLGNQAALPLDNGEMSLKDGAWDRYAEILSALDALHHYLREITNNIYSGKEQAFAETYNRTVLDLTLQVTSPVEEILGELKYLAEVGAYFNAVFKNTASPDESGITAIRDVYTFVPSPKDENEMVENLSQKQAQKQFFQVCPKMLYRSCDIYRNNCADCPDYEKFMMNSVQQLQWNLKKFFEKTLEFVDRMDKERMLHSARATISSGDGGRDPYSLARDEVIELQAKVTKALAEIERDRNSQKTVFVTEMEHVTVLRDAVLGAYGKLLGKYYKTIVDIFEVATDKAKTGFLAVCDGFTLARTGQ